jgi:predicted flap endonuclease-1-like 5' DNA nuclease
MQMRLDYVMYTIAGLFFIITIIAAVATFMETIQRSLWVISTVVLGLLSISFGYFQRPRAMVQTSQPNAPMSKTVAPQTIQVSAEPIVTSELIVTAEKSPVIETTIVVESPTQPSTTMETISNSPVKPVKRSQVKRIKGIGKKRATQLNALGINSYEELANASAANVAKSLQTSPKTVEKWISEAKGRIK